MNSKFAAILAAWLCITSAFASAQTIISLSGTVLNDNRQPLNGAMVSLYSAKDSLVKNGLTDSTGKFCLQKLRSGTYRLSVSMLGFLPYKSSIIRIDAKVGLLDIRLRQSELALQAVDIVGQKALVEHKIDRTVVNVDAMISSAGSTALEVLEKSPGVILDQNGAVTLKGKSVKVFIDDKPAYLSGTDLENYLRSLPASTISQVELMTNPPANYDAAGNGGIINIRTKKGKTKGFNGGLNLSYVQGRYARTNNSFNYNYRNGKFNLFGNLAYSTTNYYNNMDFNRHYLNTNGELLSNFLQNSYSHRSGQNYTSKMGLDYYVSEKTTFGIGFTGLYHPAQVSSLVSSHFTDSWDKPDSVVIADNNERTIYKNTGLNLNFRHFYNLKGRELTADLDYFNYSSNSNQLFNNSSFLKDGTPVNQYLLTGDLPAGIHIYSAKTDLTEPLKNGVKLVAGLKTSYTQTGNTANYFYTVNKVTAPDYGKTNHFLYQENISAGYISANKLYKKWDLQAGLRLENTFSSGHQLGNVLKRDSTFKRNYTGLFPTLYLQYKPDSAGVNQFGFNYGRRIDRPYYQDLNPFLSPLDKFTYYLGNPFLKPSYTNSAELTHTYKNRLTTTLTCSSSRDQVNETIEIVNGIYYSRPGNIGRSVFKSVSFDATFDPASWFNLHFYGQLSNIHTVSAFYTGSLDTRGTFYYLKPVLQFKFEHDWTTQIDGFYQNKVTTAQFIVGTQKRMNVAISKKLSARSTIKLVANDIFHSYVNSGIINNLALTKANYSSTSDTRTGVLAFSYRFGAAFTNQRKHEATGAESEQNRVKN